MAQKRSVTIKAAYITVAGLLVAALIAGIFSMMDKSDTKGAGAITQTVGGHGVGVINTGTGDVHAKPKN